MVSNWFQTHRKAYLPLLLANNNLTIINHTMMNFRFFLFVLMVGTAHASPDEDGQVPVVGGSSPPAEGPPTCPSSSPSVCPAPTLVCLAPSLVCPEVVFNAPSCVCPEVVFNAPSPECPEVIVTFPFEDAFTYYLGVTGVSFTILTGLFTGVLAWYAYKSHDVQVRVADAAASTIALAADDASVQAPNANADTIAPTAIIATAAEAPIAIAGADSSVTAEADSATDNHNG
jgi:hypothetical protein